jgi:hypothetical protein
LVVTDENAGTGGHVLFARNLDGPACETHDELAPVLHARIDGAIEFLGLSFPLEAASHAECRYVPNQVKAKPHDGEGCS